MATSTVFKGLGAAALVGLWLNGRRWRADHSNTPTDIGFISAKNGRTDRVFVFLEGAFNLASEHADELMDELSHCGDVLYVDYDVDYYDHQRVLNDVWARVESGSYTQICVFGVSMGAINGLWISAMFNGRVDDSVNIGNDGALGRPTLPKGMQRRFAPLAKYLRTGPVWNLVLSPLKPLMFRGIESKYWESMALEPEVREHLRVMRRYSITAIFQMIAAIATAELPSQEKLEGVRSIYIRSGNDVTRDGEAAQAAWLNLMPEATVLNMPTGWHVTYKEQPAGWLDVVRRALKVAYG